MPKQYERNISSYLIDLMGKYPVIAIVGARQVGKTTLARLVAPSYMYIDLENGADFDRVSHDPNFFFQQHPCNVIFDEAQEYPELFSVLRGVIDQNRQQNGRFIITGSSSPEILHNVSESLAGRVAIIELGTLKANEYYRQPLSPLYDVFTQRLNKDALPKGKALRQPVEIQNFWYLGGYPDPISKGDPSFYREWMTDYQSAYINRDIARLFPKLDKIAYRRFVTMLAKLSSKIINKSDLARSIGVTEPTIRNYLDIADGTFLWRTLPSYENSILKSTVKMPRGHIRDSGLLHHLLHIDTLSDLQADPIAGFSFEAFVIEEILKGLQDARVRNFDAYYYRTRSGAEIDLILEGQFGLLPIEIKYGSTVNRRQLRTLEDFVVSHHLEFGILINQASEVLWLTPHIIQIPAGFL